MDGEKHVEIGRQKLAPFLGVFIVCLIKETLFSVIEHVMKVYGVIIIWG